MSDHLDYHRNPARYQLESGGGSGRQLWALVAIIAAGVLLVVLVSGFGRTPVEHPGGATAPSVSVPDNGAASDAGTVTVPAETLTETGGQ